MQKEELQNLINTAIKKVSGNKENDLCKYIPGPSGGYMHHFTLRKIKNSNPEELFQLLKKFIIERPKPEALDPKPRAPRGSRKRREFVNFTRTDIERVLDLARKVGDQDLLVRFSPKRSLPALKRELIRSIRHNHVNHDLWNAYVESLAAMESVEEKYPSEV
jgi:hypothetical protein